MKEERQTEFRSLFEQLIKYSFRVWRVGAIELRASIVEKEEKKLLHGMPLNVFIVIALRIDTRWLWYTLLRL